MNTRADINNREKLIQLLKQLNSGKIRLDQFLKQIDEMKDLFDDGSPAIYIQQGSDRNLFSDFQGGSFTAEEIYRKNRRCLLIRGPSNDPHAHAGGRNFDGRPPANDPI